MENKYFIKLTTEDVTCGVLTTVLEVDSERIDEGVSLIRMLCGTVTNILDIQQIMKDDGGITHIKEVDMDTQQKVFNALLGAAQVEPTDEQVEAIADNLSKVFDFKEEEDE
tara:strand:+ start:4153 stop:4485 length:333 start_codon:yes stop_codon:yes gene_type:complete